MAEVLATIAIVVILFALVLIGLPQWQKTLRQQELDSKAQTIYVTVQDQMTKIIAAGQENLLKLPNDGGSADNGVCEYLGLPDDAYDKDTNEPLIEDNSLAYITSKDFAAAVATSGTAVNALFADDSIDTELLNNHWVIEYDRTTLSVYAVFYSEDLGDCSTEYSASDDDNKYRSTLRNYDGRFKDGARIGYHSGYGSSGSTTTELNPNIEVTNAETLSAKITCTAPSSSSDDGLVFKVTISDQAGDNYSKYFTFGTKFSDTGSLPVDYTTTGTCIYTTGGTITKLGRSYELDLTLDSLESDDLRFTNLYGSNSNHVSVANPKGNLLEGANLCITVEVQCPNNKTVISKTRSTGGDLQNCTYNSLFSDANGGTQAVCQSDSGVSSGNGTAVISCGRHLQNLDASSGVGDCITTANIVNNIDYGDKSTKTDDNPWLAQYKLDASLGEAESSGAASAYFNGNDSDGLPLFKPIQNSNLISISGSAATGSSAQVIGLNVNTSNAESEPAGLVGNSANAAGLTLEGLQLSGSKVVGGVNSAGVLVGCVVEPVTIQSCQVFLEEGSDYTATHEEDLNNSVWVSGSSAGGLVGSVQGELFIAGSSASTVIGDYDVIQGATSTSVSSAGGLVGSVNSGSVSISGSYADSYIYGLNAGGLVGSVSASANVNAARSYSAGYLAYVDLGAGLIAGNTGSGTDACYSLVTSLFSAEGSSYYSTVVNSGGYTTLYDANSMSAADLLQKLGGESTFTLSEPSTTKPYNLMNQGLTSYSSPTIKSLKHYGDWAAGFEEGRLVYFEKYSDGSYGFYGANVKSTLKDTGGSTLKVVGDGYGLVYYKNEELPSPINVYVNNPATGASIYSGALSTGASYDVKSEDNSYYTIYPLDTTGVINTSIVNDDSYYLNCQISSTGQNSYYYFNPHFAMSVKTASAGEAVPVLAISDIIHVRTARQLHNLSTYYSLYRDVTKGRTFKQGRDIAFTEYEWDSFASCDVVSMQQAIGVDEEHGFQATYDGSCHEVTDISFTTGSSKTYAGMFGYIAPENGVIKNVVLSAEYNPKSSKNYYVTYKEKSATRKTLYLGVLAGCNAGTISNCAVAGYYIAGSSGTVHAYSNSTLNIGGFVGLNKGTIRSSAADVPKIHMSLQYATAYAGGFVGRNTSDGVVNNSYALGSISLVEAKGSVASVAGFAGENDGRLSSSYCATALTASGSGTTTHGFAAKGGVVKSCTYLNGGTYTYVNNMYPFLFDTSSTSGSAITYAKLKATSSRGKVTKSNTHCYKNTRTKSDAYPYRGVVTNSSGEYVHYGDWQDDVNLGTLGVFYWEHETGGTNDGYHMTFLGTSAAGSQTTAVKGTSLCTAHDDGGIVSEYGYGYYVAKGQESILTATWTDIACSGKGTVNKAASSELATQMNSQSADGNKFTFYAFTTKTDTSADYIKLNSSGSSCKQNGTLKLTFKGDSATTDYQFTISPFFANAMSVDKIAGKTPSSSDYTIAFEDGSESDFTKTPGKSQTVSDGNGGQTAGNAYEVRSVDQLQYINWNGSAGNATTLVESNSTSKVYTYNTFNYLPYANRTWGIYGTVVSQKSDILSDEIMSARSTLCWTQTHDVESAGSESYSFTPIAGTRMSSGGSSYDANLYAWFDGTYDGQNYTIKNLNISSDSFNVGLFGTTVGATLKNIILYGDSSSNATIERVDNGSDAGAYSIGGLVGVAYDYNMSGSNLKTIKNCAISGYTIKDSSGNPLGLGEVNIGGLVGVSNTNLQKCSAVTNIYLDQKLYDKKNAKWGVFVRVGGLTGATQATVTDCYTGGSCSLSSDMQTKTISYASVGGNTPSQYEVYVGGIAGSGFTSNYANFSGDWGSRDGYPTVKNSYTYFEFPTANIKNKLSLKSFAIVSSSDRHAYSNSTINNCYYYGANATGKTNFSATYATTYGTPTSLTYDQMAGYATVSGNSFKDALGTSWGTVTTTDAGGGNIDGKYSFPSSTVLEGKNFPFPTVVTQNDLTFGTYTNPENVNVHYGDWPINGTHWAAGRDSVDIFEEMSSDGWTYKTEQLTLNNSDDSTAMSKAISSGDFASMFKFDDGDGTYGSASSLVDIDSVALVSGSSNTYEVKFKIKQDGSVNIRFNDRELATFTLQVSADLDLSAALDSKEDPNVFDANTNTLKLASGQSGKLQLFAKSSNADASGAQRDYSVPVTWTATSEPENYLTLELDPNDALQVSKLNVTREVLGSVSLAAVANYDYNSSAGGKVYTKSLILSVESPDIVGLSNGSRFNEASTSTTGDETIGVDTSYDGQAVKPSYSLGSASNMYLYSSGTSEYLSGDDIVDSIEIDGESYKNGEYKESAKYYACFTGSISADDNFKYMPGVVSYNSDTAPTKDLTVKVRFVDGHVLETTLNPTVVKKTELCTLTFVANGNDDAKPQTATETVVKGSGYTLEKPSVRFADTADKDALDARLDHWQLGDNESASYEVGDRYTVTGDATFKAVWKYKLDLEANPASTESFSQYVSGTGVDSIDDYDETIKPSTQVSNWVFDGWYDSKNSNSAKKVLNAKGKPVSSVDGDGYSVTNKGVLKLNKDITLYAKWHRWELTYDFDDGEQYLLVDSNAVGTADAVTMTTNKRGTTSSGAAVYYTGSASVTVSKVDGKQAKIIATDVDADAVWTVSKKTYKQSSIYDGTYFTLQNQGEGSLYLHDADDNDIAGGIADISSCTPWSGKTTESRAYFCLKNGQLKGFNIDTWSSSSASSYGKHPWLGLTGSNNNALNFEWSETSPVYAYGKVETYDISSAENFNTLTFMNGSKTAKEYKVTAAGLSSVSEVALTSSDWKFAGWYDAQGASATKVFNADGGFASSSVSFNGGSISGGKLTLTSDATLYAKWTKTYSKGYERVSGSDVTSGNYLITTSTGDNSYALLGYNSSGSSVANYTASSSDDGDDELIVEAEDNAVWKINESGDSYTITAANGSNTRFLSISSSKLNLTTSNDDVTWYLLNNSENLGTSRSWSWSGFEYRYRYLLYATSSWSGETTRYASDNAPSNTASIVFFKEFTEDKTVTSWDTH